MNDDLIKQLRANALDECDEAVDRIEALEAAAEGAASIIMTERAEVLALRKRVAAADALAELLKEARLDLAGYVAADWPEDLREKYPTYENKHRRDMALCWHIDAALAAYQATKEGE
jgi:phage I-like protein